MLPCCVALSCRPKRPAIAGSLFSEHLVADKPRNCNRLPQLEIERDFSASVEMTRCQTWRAASRAQSHIDQKLTLKPAEAATGRPSHQQILKFIGSDSRMGCQPVVFGRMQARYLLSAERMTGRDQSFAHVI